MPRRIIILMAAVLLLVSGCTANSRETEPALQEKSFVYKKVSVKYTEPNGQYGFLCDAETTETDVCKYYFEASVSASQRLDCIAATEQVLGELDSLTEMPEIYVFTKKTDESIYLEGNRLYTGPRDWHSREYAADVLLAAYGGFTHYGLALGYANLLCGQFGWTEVQAGSAGIPAQIEALDLNLLCFDPAFVTEQDVAAAEEMACRFVGQYTSQKDPLDLQDLLANSDTHSGMEALCKELAAFYHENGIDYAPSTVRYGYGGAAYDYIVDSDFAAFLVGTDWVDAQAETFPGIPENFLHSNYPEVKAFFETNLLQMAQYQALFALDDYKNDLTVFFPSDHDEALSSYYHKGLHQITLMNTSSLMHEYIHALTQPGAEHEEWEVEGFARYFSYKYDKYGIEYLNYDYNYTPRSEVPQHILEYIAVIGRPIDIAIDYAEIENIAVYCGGCDEPRGYITGSSFIQFLVKQFGEAAVIDHIYGSRQPLPKSYQTLVEEWNIYINTTYGGYSKYK